MAADQCLIIKKGDADSFTETITGLVSLSGYIARMYIYDSSGAAVEEIEGLVDVLTVVYNLTNEVSKALAPGSYKFETKIWNTTDQVYTASSGVFIIEGTIEEDPA